MSVGSLVTSATAVAAADAASHLTGREHAYLSGGAGERIAEGRHRHVAVGSAGARDGSASRFSISALTATRTLEPLIEIAAISGRSVSPHLAKTPAAMGRAREL